MAPVPASRTSGPLFPSTGCETTRRDCCTLRPAVPCTPLPRGCCCSRHGCCCICAGWGGRPCCSALGQFTPCDKQPAGSKHGCGTVSMPAETTTFPRAPPSAGPTSRGRRSTSWQLTPSVSNQEAGSTLVIKIVVPSHRFFEHVASVRCFFTCFRRRSRGRPGPRSGSSNSH